MERASELIIAVAQETGMHGTATLSTATIGKTCNVSQQTASRWLRELETQELIVRKTSAQGSVVQLTEKGKQYLRNQYKALTSILKEKKQVLKGRVSSGLGEGAYYVKQYNHLFKKVLGFKAYPGTLNVIVTEAAALQFLQGMENSYIEEFKTKDRSFGALDCYKVNINGKVNGALIIPHRTMHSRKTVELIAPIYLRGKMNIKDQDMLEIARQEK